MRVVNFMVVALKVPGEVSCTYSVGARLNIVASLLRGSRCRRCLLPGIVVDLTDVKWLLIWLLACT
jgi:hypothetical protein